MCSLLRTGVAGIAAHHAGAKMVFLTDLGTLIPLIENNARRNRIPEDATSSTGTGAGAGAGGASLHVIQYDW